MTLKGVTLAEKLRLAHEAGVTLPHYTNTENPVDFPKSKNKMNERIKELAEQAGGGPSKWYTDPDVLENFAELIVQECCQIVLDCSIPGSNNERDFVVTAREIKQHFGVEL